MKRITALVCQVEVTPYTDDNKAMLRPKPHVFAKPESEIPDAVLDWVREQLPKELKDGD